MCSFIRTAWRTTRISPSPLVANLAAVHRSEKPAIISLLAIILGGIGTSAFATTFLTSFLVALLLLALSRALVTFTLVAAFAITLPWCMQLWLSESCGNLLAPFLCPEGWGLEVLGPPSIQICRVSDDRIPRH
jgi:hypothetical protein